jgi:flavin reductase (DIM6/NTAB) family NADH-FMN oxidoreductase RutF
VAWNGVMSSRPPVFAVSLLPDSFTNRAIHESREFVVNVPDAHLVEETDWHCPALTDI